MTNTTPDVLQAPTAPRAPLDPVYLASPLPHPWAGLPLNLPRVPAAPAT